MTRTLQLCLAFVAIALASPSAYGFCLEHPLGTGGGTLQKAWWATQPITFKIHDTGSASGQLASQPDKAAEVAAVKAAFAQWAAATCAKIEFTDGGTIDSTEVVNLQHTANEIRVYWARDLAEWGLSTTGSIARTFYNQDGTGKITSAGILLNAIDKPYSTTGATDRFDVQSVVATEVGRVLGLAAVSDASSVMYPSFQQGSTSKRTLSADDAAGAAYLYPGDNDGGQCNPGTPDLNCQGTVQQDGGTTPQQDGGTTPQQDGGTTPPPDGGTSQQDAGAQACDEHSDCPSGVCGVDGICVPPADDDGCDCAVGMAGRGGHLALAVMLLGVALGLAFLRRRR